MGKRSNLDVAALLVNTLHAGATELGDRDPAQKLGGFVYRHL